MRSMFIFFLFVLALAGFAVAETSLTDSNGKSLECKGADCGYQPVKPSGQDPTYGEIRRENVRPRSGEEILPSVNNKSLVQAKGGHGGGHGSGHGGKGGPKGGGGGHASLANSMSVSNPLTILCGPIVRLNMLLTTTRAHASPDEEATSKGAGADMRSVARAPASEAVFKLVLLVLLLIRVVF